MDIYPGKMKTCSHKNLYTNVLKALFIIDLIGNNINVLKKVNG